MASNEIKNIIFDLGGVIINLDQQRTIDAFNRISTIPFEELYNQASQSDLFNRLDRGLISDYDFFMQLKKELRHTGPDHELLSAWNAMLLDVPTRRLDLLVRLRSNYRTFLLSNTCEPHIAAFEAELYHKQGVKNFQDYFDRVYYSCRMGMRKPDAEIFQKVLDDNELVPSETVFIDDSVQHVKGAGELGIRAHLLPKNMEVEDLLRALKLL